MTVDAATAQDSPGTVPGPRPTGSVGEVPWSGDRPGRRTRPLSEYWDVATARWTTRSTVPRPRRG